MKNANVLDAPKSRAASYILLSICLTLGIILNTAYGIQNVICAIRTVEKLSDTPIPINNNINARPVTISAFNIGIFVILVSIALGTFFILFMARQATTPITVAINADITANTSVVFNAFIIESFAKNCLYHLKVKPFHVPSILESLNDATISTIIGRYRNRIISAKYIFFAAFFIIIHFLLHPYRILP